MMSEPITNLVLRVLSAIDAANRDWQKKFTAPNDELDKSIGELFAFAREALNELFTCTDNTEQSKLNRESDENIVLKLKELHNSLDGKWPTYIKAFMRDYFNVDSYKIHAGEFFEPVQFYPTHNIIMKLFFWIVYDTNDTVVYRYYLEKSELHPGTPFYVLGKCYCNGRHEQLQQYRTVPNYNKMKIDVIIDLNGQGPPPIISSTKNFINL